jgi:hypothetical protein
MDPYRLLGGTLEGPLGVVSESLQPPPLLDWAGTLLLSGERTAQGTALVVRDAAAGFTASRTIDDAGGLRARMAGRSLAVARGLRQEGVPEDELDQRIDVVRLEDGQTEYSVLIENSSVLELAVQEDGKIAWLQQGRSDAHQSLVLVWLRRPSRSPMRWRATFPSAGCRSASPVTGSSSSVGHRAACPSSSHGSPSSAAPCDRCGSRYPVISPAYGRTSTVPGSP